MKLLDTLRIFTLLGLSLVAVSACSAPAEESGMEEEMESSTEASAAEASDGAMGSGIGGDEMSAEHAEGGVGEGSGSQSEEDSEGGEEGEHSEGGEGGEHDEGEEGEEGGTYIARDAEWDAVRRGVHLVLRMDDESGSFTGTVANTTEARICAVRVEVHLAGGPELGPTEQMDLAPGAALPFTLDAEGQTFETWTAHPEQSACGQ